MWQGQFAKHDRVFQGRHLWVGKCFREQVALVVKDPPANAGDSRDEGSSPGLGRSPTVGNGNPLQYSCMENSMDRRAWWLQSMRSQGVGHIWASMHRDLCKGREWAKQTSDKGLFQANLTVRTEVLRSKCICHSIWPLLPSKTRENRFTLKKKKNMGVGLLSVKVLLGA